LAIELDNVEQSGGRIAIAALELIEPGFDRCLCHGVPVRTKVVQPRLETLGVKR
jgi:hypothetical protein